MPWLHGHVPEAEHDAFFSEWQFSGVPTMVLVDARGATVEGEREGAPHAATGVAVDLLRDGQRRRWRD